MSLLVEEACNIFSLEKMKGILDAKKKGQLNIGDAPGVVLIILFLFMLMGTAGFILMEYNDAVSDNDATQTAMFEMSSNGTQLNGSTSCGFKDLSLTSVKNSTDAVAISSNNYTIQTSGWMYTSDIYYNNTNWSINYSYVYGGVSCNITEDLAEEVEDNVSIAGMVLTIALIGIVLSILIGLFYVFTGKKGM